MSNITIHPGELLWRTKGLNWEYCFLMIPEIDRGSWWRFYREVRAELTISNDCDQLIGSLQDRAGNQHPYIASIFLDSVLVDAAGRETEQFVVWFPGDSTKTAKPVDLAKAVVSHYAPIMASPEMVALSDSDETSPDELFRNLLPGTEEHSVQTKSPDSTEYRTVEIFHKLDSDLTVAEKTRGGLFKTSLLILGALIVISVMLYLII